MIEIAKNVIVMVCDVLIIYTVCVKLQIWNQSRKALRLRLLKIRVRQTSGCETKRNEAKKGQNKTLRWLG
jgi:hypothetical protein